jgi:ABC-2 type transport system permease protein
MHQFLNYIALAAAYVRLNLRAALEYRAAFWWQVGSMFVNNSMWVVFWVLFFTRFPVLRGWTVEDVITVWALAAGGFGISASIAGNSLNLATLIAQGQLDVWMLYPRRLLPHLLVGRMSVISIGDAFFGFVVYLFFVQPDPLRFLLFTLLVVAVAFLFLGFSILTGSLSFYLGNAGTLAEQWRFAMITFGTYPSVLFDGGAKFLLYTLVPAFFISQFPIEALRTLSLSNALMTFLGAAIFLALGVGVFYHGLRRYESGNLMEMRG